MSGKEEPKAHSGIVLDEQDEFSYYAAALIFGKRSSKMKKFSVFSLDTFRKYKDIDLQEASGLTAEGTLGISRYLMVNKRVLLETSHTDMVSEINKIVTVFDRRYKTRISDAVFSDFEFKKLDNSWNDQVKSKIKTFSILIRAFYFKNISPFPLFISEYPNIAKSIFSHPDYWMGD